MAIAVSGGLVAGWSCGGFCVFDAGEVAGAGADVEFAIALGLGDYRYFAEARVAGGFGAVVGEGVLAADVAGDFGGDFVDLVEGFWEKGDAAGFAREHLQGAAGVADFASRHFVAEEQADGVDDGAGELLDSADGLLEVESGGVVFAVGDDDDDLLGATGVGG